MDFDINNQQALSSGAFYAQTSSRADGWRPIATAPRDGTPVELRNNWGVAPHYGLCKWVDGRGWVYLKDECMGMEDGSHLAWRPYSGKAAAYVDPTGGMQDSPAYWRGAVASKHGLPLDYFEKQTARNVGKRRGFMSWLFDWHQPTRS